MLTSTSATIAQRVSRLCPGFIVQRYTRSKLRTDPLYEGVFAILEARHQPLLDVGCGMGILAMYLRERGWLLPILGVDYDERKIQDGQKMLESGGYQHVILQQGDARAGLPPHHGDVTILDILQFFPSEAQAQLLTEAASRLAPQGVLVIRSGLKEKNLRFLITYLVDVFSKLSCWMLAAPIHYPTKQSVRQTLEAAGLRVTITPLWGNTPFNNFRIVAERLA